MNAISILEATLQAHRPDLLQKLRKGNAAGEVAAKLEPLSVTNPVIQQIFLWRDGTEHDAEFLPDTIAISKHGYLMSLEEALSAYKQQRIWFSLIGASKEFFPVFSSGDEPSIYLSRKPGNPFVYYYATGICSKPVTIFDSWEAMVLTIARLYGEGVYWIDKATGYLESNFDEEVRISLEMNPASEFYRS